MVKAIGNYLLRVFVFFVLLFSSCEFLYDKIIYCADFTMTKFNSFESMIYSVIAIPVSIILITYYYAKITGIFKKLDGLKWIQAFLVIIILSFLMFILSFILMILNEHVSYFCAAFTLFFAYLVYIFFKYITKECPDPFQKIGYYCSIEFVSDLVKKLKN